MLMSDGMAIVTAFVLALIAWKLLIITFVKKARRSVARWDSNSTIWFVMTLGNFGARQIEVWKCRAGYGADEAKIITRYQVWCAVLLLPAFGAIIATLSIYLSVSRGVGF